MFIDSQLPSNLLASDDTFLGLSGIAEEELMGQEEVIAASKSPTVGSEPADPQETPEGATTKRGMSVRAILNSKDFASILFITTFVPYIKANTPQLREHEVATLKKRD